MSFLLITGLPGVGKTTIVQKIIKDLRTKVQSLSLQGFYTEEVRDEKGERIGFDVVSLEGNRGILSRTKAGMNYKVGKYIVYVQEFEDFIFREVKQSDHTSLLVIDEIGKMELLSRKFEIFINNLICSNSNFRVIATVPLKTPLKLIDKLKQHPKSRTFHITKSNRETVYDDIFQSTKSLVN
ncbi:CLUMA_CG015217, isoform A [Clunio marinus]|uniref:CLUMA_CG015217, isoform A n=1 Tax=Clunio marinus TaxID=568069 RepID=A0A1J1IQ59_9DIPT|nr:CLUMA_CG015217, isoform A [Clunio marinus]